mmetsp:Transcript_18767/g.54265  ORF Transcript_18767/g.54265 Transcript_18767/m.54265 type:complete len:143 (+) Transcript_18767:156-584(+)
MPRRSEMRNGLRLPELSQPRRRNKSVTSFTGIFMVDERERIRNICSVKVKRRPLETMGMRKMGIKGQDRSEAEAPRQRLKMRLKQNCRLRGQDDPWQSLKMKKRRKQPEKRTLFHCQSCQGVASLLKPSNEAEPMLCLQGDE